MTEGTEDIKQEIETIEFSEFLESIPPSTLTEITEIVKPRYYQGGTLQGYYVVRPEIQLHCPEDTCNGTRFYRCIDKNPTTLSRGEFELFYTKYRCSNCQKNEKTFSVAASLNEEGVAGRCYKFGELPTYGPPTPSRLIKLIGPDRELFLKGRRCENQGLGIGAFVYYRRVIENQKNRILDEIIKVSKKLKLDEDKINMLEDAKTETQFSKALSSVKNSIPQALLINGHNPLTLLHSALSDGLHDQTDEHCLEIANSVRVIMADLSERLAQALKDEAELNNALSKLLKIKD